MHIWNVFHPTAAGDSNGMGALVQLGKQQQENSKRERHSGINREEFQDLGLEKEEKKD